MFLRVESRPTVNELFCQWKSGDMLGRLTLERFYSRNPSPKCCLKRTKINKKRPELSFKRLALSYLGQSRGPSFPVWVKSRETCSNFCSSCFRFGPLKHSAIVQLLSSINLRTNVALGWSIVEVDIGTHLLFKGSSTLLIADLMFSLFVFSSFVTLESSTDLLVWLNPNQ